MTLRTPRPAEEVFQYLARFDHVAEWDPGVVAATPPGDGVVAIGTSFDLEVRFGRRTLPLRYEVVLLEEGRMIELLAEHPVLRSRDRIEVSADPEGTVVTYDATLSLKGAWAVLSPLLAWQFNKIGDRAAEGLRTTLVP
jgi:Polyketide cyclase / dehydrase and lipid transport